MADDESTSEHFMQSDEEYTPETETSLEMDVSVNLPRDLPRGRPSVRGRSRSRGSSRGERRGSRGRGRGSSTASVQKLPKRGRGTRGRGRGSSTASATHHQELPKRARGTRGQRRGARGGFYGGRGGIPRVTRDDAERVQLMQQRIRDKVKDDINALTKEQLQQVLLRVVEREPGILFNIHAMARGREESPPPRRVTPPAQTSSPRGGTSFQDTLPYEEEPPLSPQSPPPPPPYSPQTLARSPSPHPGPPSPPTPPPAQPEQYPQWCSCGECIQMPTLLECLCCNQPINECAAFMPHMDALVLDPMNLHIDIRYRNDIFGGQMPDDEAGRAAAFRHAAYRRYTLLRHGRLGAGVRRVIPSCIVKRVRESFPDPNGHYTGFLLDRLA